MKFLCVIGICYRMLGIENEASKLFIGHTKEFLYIMEKNPLWKIISHAFL